MLYYLLHYSKLFCFSSVRFWCMVSMGWGDTAASFSKAQCDETVWCYHSLVRSSSTLSFWPYRRWTEFKKYSDDKTINKQQQLDYKVSIRQNHFDQKEKKYIYDRSWQTVRMTCSLWSYLFTWVSSVSIYKTELVYIYIYIYIYIYMYSCFWAHQWCSD